MAVTVDEARRLALFLPQVTEQDHHGMASFRIRGKIFAAVLHDQHLRVMVDEDEIRARRRREPSRLPRVLLGQAPDLPRR